MHETDHSQQWRISSKSNYNVNLHQLASHSQQDHVISEYWNPSVYEKELAPRIAPCKFWLVENSFHYNKIHECYKHDIMKIKGMQKKILLSLWKVW
jgi:hypothetical protein